MLSKWSGLGTILVPDPRLAVRLLDAGLLHLVRLRHRAKGYTRGARTAAWSRRVPSPGFAKQSMPPDEGFRYF